MIGNDIVDLNLAKTQNNWERKGFLEKQFTNKEIKIINQSQNSFITVWLFWSMKEAAYKIWNRKEGKRAFNPKKFSCKLTNKTEGVVQFDDYIIFTQSVITNNYIFTESSLKVKTKMCSGVSNTNTIKDKLINKVAETLEIDSQQLRIKKSKLGTPSLFRNNQPIVEKLSFTHHGNFHAYSFCI